MWLLGTVTVLRLGLFYADLKLHIKLKVCMRFLWMYVVLILRVPSVMPCSRTCRTSLRNRGIEKSVATVITQVLVDKTDKAFQNPTKPIGGFMDEAEAQQRIKDLGWNMVEDSGRGWRRVVASPIPQQVVELESVNRLIDAGHVVITVGGGGIPVIEDNGILDGTAAVIDKDYASSLLAREINADLFVDINSGRKSCLKFW